MDLRIKAALISIFVNIFLIALKFLLARISGSAAIHADAWHSLSDLVVSFLVLGGLKVTSTQERRSIVNWRGLEHVIAIGVGAFIIYTAWRIFAGALRPPTVSLRNVGWVILGALVCALVSYVIAVMKIRVGKIKGSPSLVADGYHSKMDVYSTVAVIIGLFGVTMGIDLDRAAAGLVSILIAMTGIEIMIASIRAITAGASLSEYLLWFVFERGRKDTRFSRFLRRIRVVVDWLSADRRYVYIIACLVVILWVFSGFFIIREGEEGLVYRFGSLIESGIEPGLHFHAPFPIETVQKIEVAKIRRVELGFRSVGPLVGTARAYEWESRHQGGGYQKRLDESLIFTGDENIIDVNTVVQYRIRDAIKYALNVEAPKALVSSYALACLRWVISLTHIESLLTTDRSKIEQDVANELQKLLDESKSGIEVVGVKLQDVHPPIEVVSAFREVASAREDKNRFINQALAYQDSLIPEARGAAVRLLEEAHAESTEMVEHAYGEAKRFLYVVKEYERHRDVTALRMYLETMENVLPGLDKFLVEPDIGAEPLDLRFFDENVIGQPGGW